MYMLKKGDNAGFPFIYYDQIQHKKILAPEYGGDGKLEGSKEYIDPLWLFPGIWLQMVCYFIQAKAFPKNTAMARSLLFMDHGIAHLKNKRDSLSLLFLLKMASHQEIGKFLQTDLQEPPEVMSPRQAKHRPCGLAQGPDGALYVTDDVKGNYLQDRIPPITL